MLLNTSTYNMLDKNNSIQFAENCSITVSGLLYIHYTVQLATDGYVHLLSSPDFPTTGGSPNNLIPLIVMVATILLLST